MEQLINKIMLEKTYLKDCRVKALEKGWSRDKKYILSNGKIKCIVTLFQLESYERKLKQFNILRQMIERGVKTSTPIDIDKYDGYGYMIVSYIEGVDGEECLTSLPEEVQYHIGLQAGKELRLIHQMKAPRKLNSWYERKKRKHERYMAAYNKLDLVLANESHVLSFIEDNMELMKNRPNLFQHDDFHVGNLIIKNDELVGVIDFELMDYGDPIHEFVKIGTISIETSIPYCIGQIHGYLNTTEPDEKFWRLYCLYNCMTAIASVVWYNKYHPTKYDEGLLSVYEMMKDHNNFQDIKPKWFTDKYDDFYREV